VRRGGAAPGGAVVAGALLPARGRGLVGRRPRVPLLPAAAARRAEHRPHLPRAQHRALPAR
jgi:hypothetical protein